MESNIIMQFVLGIWQQQPNSFFACTLAVESCIVHKYVTYLLKWRIRISVCFSYKFFQSLKGNNVLFFLLWYTATFNIFFFDFIKFTSQRCQLHRLHSWITTEVTMANIVSNMATLLLYTVYALLVCTRGPRREEICVCTIFSSRAVSTQENTSIQWVWLVSNGCIWRACRVDSFHGITLVV